ncbi:hypothetical protein J421_1894 [Gemmatirosa kalamazoonensis]|uniref:Lipoprotein n=1 Tax=Gemmatirosa kalamazoonensis TaxID=861299 RepID=W0RF58_9BACT|nr:hypothetical protein [Gemmatirosa kalamazoonensis]AHG89431.1 hypothetical protein J421_1894 [Gemmatirosa kalamazoonensis]
MRMPVWTTAMLVLAGMGCERGAVNPCDRPFPDVDRLIDVSTAGTGAASLARLRVVQRYAPGIDDGCAQAVPVRLSFVGSGPSAVSFTYRVTWSASGGSGGWFRGGVVTRLGVGAELDAGIVRDGAPIGEGTIAVAVTDMRALDR